MKNFILASIRFYQKHISVHLPPMCKYYPTCSRYAVEAIEIHGALKGSIMAVLRLLRCNPLFVGGYDPVPPKKGDKTRGCHNCQCQDEQKSDELDDEL